MPGSRKARHPGRSLQRQRNAQRTVGTSRGQDRGQVERERRGKKWWKCLRFLSINRQQAALFVARHDVASALPLYVARYTAASVNVSAERTLLFVARQENATSHVRQRPTARRADRYLKIAQMDSATSMACQEMSAALARLLHAMSALTRRSRVASPTPI